MSWIKIVRWNEFQHYADRDPVWIKDYVRQLRDDAYLSLTMAQRGLLKDLRLLYAGSRREVVGNTARISRALNGHISNAQLIALEDAGFIEISASRPLALARARVEEEKEKDPLNPPKRKPRTTGWRLVRGSHGITHVPDPDGTDKPPANLLRPL